MNLLFTFLLYTCLWICNFILETSIKIHCDVMMDSISVPTVLDIFLAWHQSYRCDRTEAALNIQTILPYVFILLTLP